MIKLLIIVGVTAFAFGIAALIGIWLERKEFNNGVCLRCQERLKFFDYDSQGGRGYKCESCGYKVWISYNTVDRRYENVCGRESKE